MFSPGSLAHQRKTRHQPEQLTPPDHTTEPFSPASESSTSKSFIKSRYPVLHSPRRHPISSKYHFITTSPLLHGLQADAREWRSSFQKSIDTARKRLPDELTEEEPPPPLSEIIERQSRLSLSPPTSMPFDTENPSQHVHSVLPPSELQEVDNDENPISTSQWSAALEQTASFYASAGPLGSTTRAPFTTPPANSGSIASLYSPSSVRSHRTPEDDILPAPRQVHDSIAKDPIATDFDGSFGPFSEPAGGDAEGIMPGGIQAVDSVGSAHSVDSRGSSKHGNGEGRREERSRKRDKHRRKEKSKEGRSRSGRSKSRGRSEGEHRRSSRSRSRHTRGEKHKSRSSRRNEVAGSDEADFTAMLNASFLNDFLED